uniref:Uncharacterized protein n=1 Tax=Acrobeloides nanus TaxID=290746 RepID=A0A914DXH0_9BILA
MAVNSSSFFLHDIFPTVLRYSYPLALTTQTCGVYLTDEAMGDQEACALCYSWLCVIQCFEQRTYVVGAPIARHNKPIQILTKLHAGLSDTQ